MQDDKITAVLNQVRVRQLHVELVHGFRYQRQRYEFRVPFQLGKFAI